MTDRIVSLDEIMRARIQERNGGHWPEELCFDCLRANPVWYAPNALWNRVMGDEAGIVCPTCFARRAGTQGMTFVWQFQPDKYEAWNHAP